MSEHNDETYEPELLTLSDEDGNEQEFEIIDSLELGDDFYYALVPILSDESIETDDGDLVILKVITEEESGDEILATIDDDDEYDKVAGIFADKLSEFYEIDEEE